MLFDAMVNAVVQRVDPIVLLELLNASPFADCFENDPHLLIAAGEFPSANTIYAGKRNRPSESLIGNVRAPLDFTRVDSPVSWCPIEPPRTDRVTVQRQRHDATSLRGHAATPRVRDCEPHSESSPASRRRHGCHSRASSGAGWFQTEYDAPDSTAQARQ